MSELTIHTGAQGDETRINVDWFDHNMIHHQFTLQIRVLPQDKPRKIVVMVDSEIVASSDIDDSKWCGIVHV